MYFEVAARQSGKTTRLMNDLLGHYLELMNIPNKKVIVFSPKRSMRTLVELKVFSLLKPIISEIGKYNSIENNILFISSKEEIEKYIISLNMIMRNNNNVKIYIDDVFNCAYLYPYLKEWVKDLNLMENIYCSGSIDPETSLSKDIFSLLKEANKNHFLKITRIGVS